MRFTYTASTKKGKTVTATIDALSKEAVISKLRHEELRPLTIHEVSNKKTRHTIFKKKVPIKDLVVFTRQLSTLFSAGVPLNRSIDTLGSQMENPYFKTVIAAIGKDVQAGNSLGDAFEKHPAVFNEVYVSMVKAGEQGGILDDILKRLSAQIESEASIRKKVKSAMMYPVVILSITIFAFFGIMIFIIPKINRILIDLGGPDAKLPIYTRILLGFSNFMQQYIVLIIAVLVIAVIMLRRYTATPTGKYNLHSLLLRTPIIKNIVIKLAIARFARTFASLMAAGVGVLDALAVTGGAIGNKVIEKELAEAAKAVKAGKQLSQPIAASPHFPAIVGQMLAVGEETGQIDTVLTKVADFYEEEVETVIDGLSSIIEPIMIVILGAFVGLIAASVMGPIASLTKNIGTN